MNESNFRSFAIDEISKIEKIPKKELYVVWICKILQNNKCLISTDFINGVYYEVTYNGDKNEFYFDKYIKESNLKIAGVE